jgi:hypothetical protein
MALMLVLAAVAAASIMGYAILANSAMHAQASSNGALIASADALAESGVNLACYYLEHPERAPVLSSGVYPGQSNVSLGDGGVVNISVSQTDENGVLLPPRTYRVTATALVGPPGRGVQRTLRTTVYVDSRYEVRHALATNSDFRLPLLQSVEVRDDSGYARADDSALIRSDGHFQADLLTSVFGNVAAASSNLSLSRLLPLPTYPTRAVPTRTGDSQLNLLKNIPFYTYNGQTYQMQQLTADQTNYTFNGNLATNPLNVWYTTSSRRLSGNCRLPGGTLIVVGSGNRNLTISGKFTASARPDPSTGRPVLPVLVIDNDLIFASTDRELVASGVVWIGGNISQTGVANLVNPFNKIEISGALMFAGAPSAIHSSYTGSFDVHYERSQVQDLWDLCDTDRIPQSVKILSWTN